MKNRIFFSIIGVFIFASASLAQEKIKPKIWEVELYPNKVSEVDGSLKDGALLNDYSWAWNSANACFPATQKTKFTGNHVFYVVKLPSRSILTVTVRPTDKSKNLSLYGYQIAAGQIILPENLQRSVTCEADYKWDYPKRGKTQNETRTISFNAAANSYNVMIGVTGTDGLTTADFTLSITLKQ